MASPGGYPQSPFLERSRFAAEEPDVIEQGEAPTISHRTYHPRSPFLSAYEVDGNGRGSSAVAEEFVSVLAELHDHEFDEAVFELVGEAAGLRGIGRFDHEGYHARGDAEVEHLLATHFAPLVREAEALVDHVTAGVRGRSVDDVGDAELEALIDQYVPRGLSPTFEQFLGGLKKKLKGLAKKGLDLAKRGVSALATMGLGPLLAKIKPMMRLLVERVLKAAFGKLPPTLRPYAEKLRAQFLKEAEADEPQPTDDASADVTAIQHEFDAQLGTLLFAREAIEQEAVVAAYEGPDPEENPIERLNEARAQFAAQIRELEPGADATPHVEQFIPALLPALKLGFKLVGQKRVKSLLARLVAKLISPFVGKEQTPALARALVDAGLRLLNLETTPQDDADAAAGAVAATVEETVRRVAAAPEYVLRDEQLFQGFVVQAFESAAAGLLPPVLNERAYEARPELRESTLGGAWVFRPQRDAAKQYQKYSRTPEITITPPIARGVRTYGGTRLGAYLQRRFGLPPGRSIRARVHLYRAIPGTSLARVAALEKRLAGQARESNYAVGDFHPLTPEAAGVLLQEPGLAATVEAEYLAGPYRTAVNQRFYRLEIAGAPQPMISPHRAGQVGPRASEVNLTLDFPRSQIRVFVFISEREAQQFAAKMREQGSTGADVIRLHAILRDSLEIAADGRLYGHVKLVHPNVDPEQSSGRALTRLPLRMQTALFGKITEWAGRGLAEQLPQRMAQFIAATEEDADGVTLLTTLDAPPGFAQLREALGTGPVGASVAWAPDGTPEIDLALIPGFRRD